MNKDVAINIRSVQMAGEEQERDLPSCSPAVIFAENAAVIIPCLTMKAR
jgi:hypothetical protein